MRDLRRDFVEQIERGCSLSPELAAAFATVPREAFVPEGFQRRDGTWAKPKDRDFLTLVYRDDVLVTKLHGRTPVSSSSQPSLMAIMIMALDVRPGLRVLEIGAGTGYNAALLASLGATVTSVDVQQDVAHRARVALARAGIGRARVVHGDGYAGAPGEVFDRVIVTVGVAGISPHWLDQMEPGSVVIAPIEHAGTHPVLAIRQILPADAGPGLARGSHAQAGSDLNSPGSTGSGRISNGYAKSLSRPADSDGETDDVVGSPEDPATPSLPAAGPAPLDLAANSAAPLDLGGGPGGSPGSEAALGWSASGGSDPGGIGDFNGLVGASGSYEMSAADSDLNLGDAHGSPTYPTALSGAAGGRHDPGGPDLSPGDGVRSDGHPGGPVGSGGGMGYRRGADGRSGVPLRGNVAVSGDVSGSEVGSAAGPRQVTAGVVCAAGFMTAAGPLTASHPGAHPAPAQAKTLAEFEQTAPPRFEPPLDSLSYRDLCYAAGVWSRRTSHAAIPGHEQSCLILLDEARTGGAVILPDGAVLAGGTEANHYAAEAVAIVDRWSAAGRPPMQAWRVTLGPDGDPQAPIWVPRSWSLR